ncbi:MAG: NAD(P)-dependent glycerol-3-phosphate dehydrogenase [Ignavibacteriales bacterium]|nr:NAD(P)-dependent glycerol-3-phosphate dehydrogenase [Ignavibacteriales bacterium]
MRVAVLGAGSWGTTLALVLAENFHEVALWTYSGEQAELMRATRENPDFLPGIPVPEFITILTDIEKAAAGKDMIVAAVPSQFLRSVLQQIAHLELSQTIIVNVAKGIENHSLMTMSEVMLDVLAHEKKSKLAILSGPSHAEEVSKRIPTAVVAASFNARTAKAVAAAFSTPYFRVYLNDDIYGVELGGALKNVIAIGAGIGDGAGYGDNTKAAIMTRGVAEMSRLGIKMGALPRTFAGLSGVGDLFVTCMSKHSRNRYVGEEIGRGRTLQVVLDEMVMVAEGVATCQSSVDLALKHHVDLAVFTEVHRVLFENKNPRQAMEELMTREIKRES